jgi:hypothetical protein
MDALGVIVQDRERNLPHYEEYANFADNKSAELYFVYQNIPFRVFI